MPPIIPMNDSDYHRACDELFARLEKSLEAADADFDYIEGVLEIELERGEKIIVNRQPAAREVWLASRAGGRHYRQNAAGEWRDTRDDGEITAHLRGLLD